jgi:Arc-like DNA binding domain
MRAGAASRRSTATTRAVAPKSYWPLAHLFIALLSPKTTFQIIGPWGTNVTKKKANPAKPVTRVTTRRLGSKMAAGTDSTSDQFQFRLPDGMRDQLAEAATANGRSLNDEIIHRLTQSLERDGMQKKLSQHLKIQGDRLAKVEEEIADLVQQLRLNDD